MSVAFPRMAVLEGLLEVVGPVAVVAGIEAVVVEAFLLVVVGVVDASVLQVGEDDLLAAGVLRGGETANGAP